MSEATCNTCVFALFKDYGYSNYTTEGTQFFCLKGKHPDDGFDRFYGEDLRLDHAKNCADYKAGEPVILDVDHEQWPGTEHPEAIAMMEARGMWS